MHLKDEIINQIIDVEGGYVNDPSDSGGETNIGITEAVARAAGYQGRMREDFDQHKVDFEEHKAEQEHRWGQLATMVEKNTQATERIAEAVEKQAESTAGVVQLYTDFRGAARIGVGLQKFLAWLIALGSFGAAVAAAITYVIDKFMPGSAGP